MLSTCKTALSGIEMRYHSDKDDNTIYVNYYNNRKLIFISFAHLKAPAD